MHSKPELRIQLRAKRRALSVAHQQQSAKRLAHHLLNLSTLRGLRHIAVYWPADGEIDPRKFIDLAAQRGVQIYLPIITADDLMHFAVYKPQQPLQKNTYGIPEPHCQPYARKAIWQMDAVLMPLVGFDRHGNRLGMGKGFYDRALTAAFGRIKQPQYWGLAHSFQQLEQLPIDTWDKPLRGVVTERGVQQF
jgi:5-formyltetrahydrofolate cyclo-ligase